MFDAQVVRSSGLLGRDAELDRVRRLLDTVRDGTGGVLLVTGGPGTGRTALLSAAADRAAEGGAQVLLTRGTTLEGRIPCSGLERLLRPVLHHLDALSMTAEKNLTRALTEGRCPPGRVLRVATAVLDLLQEASAERPVVAVVDDAHLLDPASASVLGLVASRLEGSRVALVFSARSDRHGSLPALEAVWGMERIDLGPLEHDAARRLITEHAPVRVAGHVMGRLLALADGVPAAMVDLASALTYEQCAGTADLPRTLPLGSRLRSDRAEVVSGLSTGALWFLLLVVVDEHVRVGEALAAAEAAGTDPDGLGELRRSGLVNVDGTVLRLVFPWLRGAVLERTPPARLREAHHALAAVVEQQRHPLRHHLHRVASLASVRPRDAVVLARTAQAGPPVLATRALEWAAGAGEPDAGPGHLVEAARQAWRAGDPARARELARRVAERTSSFDAVGSRLRLLEGEMAVLGGAATRGRARLVETAAALTERDPAAALAALALTTEAIARVGDVAAFEEVERHLGPLLGKVAGPAAEFQEAFVRGTAAAFRQEHGRAQQHLGTVVTMASSGAGSWLDVAVLCRASSSAFYVGNELAARRLGRLAVAAARHREDHGALPLALQVLSYADLALGRHESAATASLEGVRLARLAGQDAVADDHLAMLALLAAMSGDADTCRLRLRELRQGSDAEPTAMTRGTAAWAMAVLDLHAGRYGAASRRLGAVVGGGRGHVVLQVPATFHLVEAFVRSGAGPDDPRREGLFAALDEVEAWAGWTGNPTWEALVVRSRAQLTADLADAQERFRTAVDLHLAGDSDFAYARTELLFGEELRRNRRPAEAREHLRIAMEVFDQLDETIWRERAASELRAAGEQVASPVSNLAQLTPRQEQIARLVADGATNKEVAEQMFLSTRTVDHHLRGVFERLGVRSRTELAKLLA